MPLPAWAPIAVNAVGSALSALGGSSAAKQSAKQASAARKSQERMGYAGMEQNERQFGFNANMGRANQLDGRSVAAADMQGRINRAPLADQAQYLIQQRLGLGNVVNGMGNAAAAYRPGMGGVDTSYMVASRDRLADESQVPGEYQSQSGQQMRLTALRDEYMQQLALAKKPNDRATWEKRIRELDRILGAEAAGGSGVDGYDPELYVPEMPEMIQRMLRSRAGITMPGGLR